MKSYSWKFLRFIFILLIIARCASAPNLKSIALPEASKTPKRVMVLVFDQLRPDFIERFDLKNFKKLKTEGVSFPNAIVGHLSSVTVVSHPVITTGLFPKHLPWQDEFLRDDQGKLGAKGTFYSVLDLEPKEFKTLLKHTAPVSLLSRVTDKQNSKHTYTLGQKQYAVMGLGAPLAGTVMTLGPKMKSPSGWRSPSGFNVPNYFLEPFLGRFYLDCNATFGSEDSLYPLDGYRFVTGSDETHLGGDTWVADSVTAILNKDPDWKAVFATFGSIDKMLHILAEHENATTQEWAIKNHLTLKETLEKADEALGKIITTLETNGQWDETAIIITADHGGQANDHFHGLTQKGLGTNYLFFARAKNRENVEMPKSLTPILKSNEIEAISHDSGLRIWTRPISRNRLSELASEVSKLPGVAEVYTLQKTENRFHYIRTFRSQALLGSALEWANQHNADLLETMVNESAANIVALLLDGHGYGFQGDHGGTQEWVQRVPLIIRSPNILEEKRGSTGLDEVRLVDINPIASRLLGLSLPSGLDGSAKAIEGLFK